MRNVNPETERKRKIRRAVIVEIIVMSAGVLCCMLPLPWRLGVLIVIGAREIIIKGIRAARENPPNAPHCCGAKEPKRKKPAGNKAESTKRSDKK